MRERTLVMLMASILLIAGFASGQARVLAKADVQVTEEGQRIIVERSIWQMRELSKRLPLDQPWPAQADLDKAFVKYGLDKSALPAEIVTPTQISPHIYLVNSADTLTYLVDCGGGSAAIFDPGFETAVEKDLAGAEQAGFKPASIKWVVNTHSHGDHSQGNAAILKKTGAQLIIGAPDADAIENPVARMSRANQAAAAPAARSGRGGPMPAAVPVKVDRRISTDETTLRLGERDFRLFHIQGHTPGSVAFLLEDGGQKLLISGDVLLYDYRLPGMAAGSTENDRQYAAAIRRVAKALESDHPNVLLPGHGAIVLDRAYVDILKDLMIAEHNIANGLSFEFPFGASFYRTLMFGRP
jgi:glyoxylase-like metal-dependent hydrolase (beta-lactamase superfamily II)